MEEITSRSRSTYPIRTVTCLSLLLGTCTIISAEVWQRAFTRDATDIGCFIFTPLASKQSFRVKDVGRSSTVTETAAARSKAVVLLSCGRGKIFEEINK